MYTEVEVFSVFNVLAMACELAIPAEISLDFWHLHFGLNDAPLVVFILTLVYLKFLPACNSCGFGPGFYADKICRHPEFKSKFI